jgi:hypothetical protein
MIPMKFSLINRPHPVRKCLLILATVLLLLSPGCLGGNDQPCTIETPKRDIAPFVSLVEDYTNQQVVTANVRVMDIDDDGADEVVFTEPLEGRIAWVQTPCQEGEDPTGTYWSSCQETWYSDGLTAPVRTDAGDLNGDGYTDIIVADIGILWPSDEPAGSVVVLWGSQDGIRTNQTIISGIGRTVCAEAADLDGDGDLDLTLCEFGHQNGSVSWLENDGDGNWTQHVIEARPGAIHAMPFDADNDGDIDIAVSISQLEEAIMLYRNDGQGMFSAETLFNSTDTFYGMSGLRIMDLDEDGDDDIVFTNGDTMDRDVPDGMNPYDIHGVAWLENDAGLFTYHELTRHWGAYDTLLYDVDEDGDEDLIVVSLQFDDLFPITVPRQEVIWLERDGNDWVKHEPVQVPRMFFITIGKADMDGDGDLDIIGASHDSLGQAEDPARLGELLAQVEPAVQVCP